MKFFKSYLLPFLLIVACSNSEMQGESSNPARQDGDSTSIQSENGMIHLSGGKVTVGSNEKEFKTSEKPAMQVVLDYDFFMDIHEVTCGDYDKIAKEAGLNRFSCKGDSLPIADITYYDALLFANAKSHQKNRDTVYTYSKATFDTEGHCINLEGLAFHPETEGFRLPTEAEWIYAATRAWDPEKSWNSNNSGFAAREVCGAGTDSAGFCDMAGNVMEWVNDWLGLFRDTVVTNYVGAPDGGDMGERIVKGGSYALSPKELTPYSRGDIYTVTSATRANYVGFRLALGSIPEALWMGNDGKSQASIVTPLAGSETIKTITGTYNARLAFRNDVSGNLVFIDYRNQPLSVIEIEDTLTVYHPDISPDGNHVAFCTGLEGVSGKSKIYVRDLSEKGPNLVKLNVESAAIPRWRVLENGDTAIVYVSDAGNNKNGDAFKSASTWQVAFKNGRFGTPQKLFDGAYHGGISEDNTLAVTGARLLRARIAKSGSTLMQDAKDAIWYDSAQACNASLAQDGSKRTAFLDFAGKPGQKFVGSDYSTHERIFIADSTGKLIQSVKAPAGYTFDHTEWATNGVNTNIVATLANANGAHTKIVIVNPVDSSVTELAEGDELWHPALWVERNKTTEIDTDFEFNLDSAGMYYNTTGPSTFASRFRYKMEFLWQYKDSANVAILGSSRAYYGINPILFSKPVFAVNFAVPATIISGNGFFFNHYVLPHVSKLKVAIFSIDLDRAFYPGDDTDNMFYEAYKFYPGFVYDMNHNYWVNQNTEELFKATFNSPGVNTYAKKLRPTRGYDESEANGWGSPTIKQDSVWTAEKKNSFQDNLNLFKTIIQTCAKKNIYVIGVLFPLNPKYKNTGAYGSDGLQRSLAPKLIKEISSLSETYSNFTLIDENKMGNHDYSDDEARDYSHLSKAGAEKITLRLDSLIQTLNIDFDH